MSEYKILDQLDELQYELDELLEYMDIADANGDIEEYDRLAKEYELVQIEYNTLRDGLTDDEYDKYEFDVTNL